MKGDFTRNTFRPEQRYSRVLQQQGRVQLDSDWNEAFDIVMHDERQARRDIIGCHGGPEGNAGYQITVDTKGSELKIGKGHYYVDGILCLNDSDLNFKDQIGNKQGQFQYGTESGRYLAYLDVWERYVTALEDPEIQEVALGDADTAARTQVVAQVKLAKVANGATCQALGDWKPQRTSGRLMARAQLPEDEDRPCVVPPTAGYRRLENQLYRVEIHKSGGRGNATFKWSRENGSVVVKWLDQVGNRLIVDHGGWDDNLGFHTGDWVELIDDERELRGDPGVLVKLAGVDGLELEIEGDSVDFTQFYSNPKVRRWDSDGEMKVEIPTENDDYIRLEDGVEICFENGEDGDKPYFKSGDYWLIPARTALRDVLWPADEAQATRGVERFYAPLALLNRWTSDEGDKWELVSDCRCIFKPLCAIPTAERGCCTVTVGNGSISHGDFDDIHQAIIDLKERFSNGTLTAAAVQICILPGVYNLNSTVVIEGLPGKNIVIKGCGQQSWINAPKGLPAFFAKNCRIRFESLKVAARSRFGAIDLWQCVASSVRDCVVFNGVTTAVEDRFSAIMPEASPFMGAGPAVVALGSAQITVEDSTLFGTPAIILQAIDGTVQRNFCRGGAWIWDGSSLVEIAENRFIGASGPGVLLGGYLTQLSDLIDEDLLSEESGVRGVSVRSNRILWMTHSGIASATELDDKSGLGDLEDITITDNTIFGCARQPIELAAFPLDGDGVGGIVLNNVSRLQIRGNTILENGPKNYPACGILVEDGEGVEIVDNHIAENGADRISPQCVDFSEVNELTGDQPLRIFGVCFQYSDSTSNSKYQVEVWKSENNGDRWNGTKGLRCDKPITISLPRAMRSVTLHFVGLKDSSATVEAFNAADKSVGEPARGAPSKLEWFKLEVNGIGIKSLQISGRTNQKKLLLVGVCGSEFVGYQAGIAALWAYGGEYQGIEDKLAVYQPGHAALRVCGNTVVCPAGQALWATGVGPIQISDNVFTSRGRYVQPVGRLMGKDELANASWLNLAQVGCCVSIVDLGVALELLASRLTSLFKSAPHPTLGSDDTGDSAELPFGFVQYHGNQSTFQLKRQASSEWMVAFGSETADTLVSPTTFIVSLDDVAIQDNQIRANVEGPTLIANALTIGPSVRVNNNRFSERLSPAGPSCVSVGFFNNTTGNLATHCIDARGSNVENKLNQQILCKDKKS